MDCKSYHKKCEALCCKTLSFYFHKEGLTREQINHYNLYEGVTVVERKDFLLVVIKTKCKNLGEDLSCKVYEKGAPKICKKGYSEIKQGVVFLPGCGYEPDKDSIVLTKEEAERLGNGIR